MRRAVEGLRSKLQHHVVMDERTKLQQNTIHLFVGFEKFDPQRQVLAFHAPCSDRMDLMMCAKTGDWTDDRRARNALFIKEFQNLAVKKVPR